ncbi:hypothetical protein H8E88_34140 [candidate division KSB1 bacterium]|nr:hypothetical protein [candidate division KSB1 bacterium]MBL7095451.1 hypothetical protein [candidate division KSB1 bacterium]
MRKLNFKIFWVVFALFVFINGAQAQTLNWSGYARNYTGMLLTENNEYAILQNTFNLNIEQSKDKVAYKVNPYIYQYPNQEMEIGLREAYMDIYFNAVDLRIGKQQIIWGKADGVFITDIVSPKDLSEFLLRDFDEIRMGVTSLKANYYLGDNTFEFVWAPNFVSTQMPDESSIWFPQLDFPTAPVFDYSQKEVGAKLENSEVFAKFSAITSAMDFEIMGGYAWDDDPTMHIAKNSTGLTVTPRHHRLGLAGGSFSSTLGGFVLRGEGAYYNGKYFNSEDPKLTDGTVKKNYIHYLVGLDYTLWDIRLSSQFIQQAILDYEKPIKNDEYENTMTVLASKDFLRETLRLELFSYIGLNNSDALIRPKVIYDLADGFELLLGANIFVGDAGRFGQYDGNDMVYAKVKYSF